MAPLHDAAMPAVSPPAAGDAGRMTRKSDSIRLEAAGPKQLWLDAWADPVAGLEAFSSCITTCNLCGDGDWRLVVADADMTLKVWKGTQKASEVTLPDVPIAVCSFLADLSPPRLPTLAVAAGAHVYMFQNLRPHAKFTLPPAGGAADEEAVWQAMQAGQVSAASGAQQLQQLQQGGLALATRSLQLLALPDPAEQQDFAATSGSQQQHDAGLSCITCMDVIPAAADAPDGVGQLVVGTEDKRALVLGPGGTAVACSIALPATPAFLAVSGGADAGYRVAAAARDGRVYSIVAGALSQTVVQLEAQPVGVACLPKQLVVGTMADVLQGYSAASGARQWSLLMPAAITGLRLLPVSSARALKCVVVSLANGEVRLYRDKALLSVHASASPVLGLHAGRYAREDNSLVVVTAAGGLDIKILPRSANLEVATAGTASGPPPEQHVPLDVPKKTRLYVEQMQREREHAVDMHRMTQRGMAKLQLATARALVKVLTDGQGSHAAAANLSMDVTIQGLGPHFRLLIHLANEGQELVTSLQVLVQAVEPQLYRVHASHLLVPSLVPGLRYTYKADVTCLTPDQGAGALKLLVVGSAGLTMTATVHMPLSEPED